MKFTFSETIIFSIFSILTLIFSTISCKSFLKNDSNELAINSPLITTDEYVVKDKINREHSSFYTQGIFFDNNNNLIESGGLYGQSILIKMKFPELKEISRQNVNGNYFGEGTAKCGDYIYQLTWREGVILKYKSCSLEKQESLTLDPEIGQGWGLSQSGDGNLYESNGSSRIYKLDCNNLKIMSYFDVIYKGGLLDNINALAYAEGFIWANRYYDSRIFKIDPVTGYVVEAYNMDPVVQWELKNSKLTAGRLQSGDVLNGIAYNKSDPKNPYFLITGKKWDHYFTVYFK